ncbi:hypothetical protein B0H14DRAFT_2586168 [Mycena olivaceomarginata]|nr:hypothetical protein B0H14DRAFT_2586168 [Mycena olivaceomarginata]
MGFKFITLALLPCYVGRALAGDVFIDLPITNAVVAPDGFSRSAIQAGAFPGTNIVAMKGDTLHINVSNHLVDPTMRRSTSIHWHGLFQDRTASEDGPSFVNQCPIAPGTFYQYNFNLGDQTGTYWFHSHLSTQYADGERGTLVICKTTSLLHYLYRPFVPDQLGIWWKNHDVDDASTIITLVDWYHTPAEQAMAQFKADGHEPVPASGLFNSVGRYNGGPAVPCAFAAYTFSIDQHVFDVIKTDGIATVPLRNATASLFWQDPVQHFFLTRALRSVDKDNVKAILRYAGAPAQDPVTSAGGGGSAKLLQEFQLATLINLGAPGGSAAVQPQTDAEMFSTSVFALGYGSDTKFDVNKRQKERMMRKCVIEYIGAASEFIGTILFILCSSAIDLPADAESEITPVLSPITTTSRHEERGSHFLATIPTIADLSAELAAHEHVSVENIGELLPDADPAFLRGLDIPQKHAL